MGNLVSIAQFREAISQLIENDLAKPWRDRQISSHPSAELFIAGGDKVAKLKVKFYIEDDGGDWDFDNLVKPHFIWDLKKVSGGYLIDAGYHTFHMNLKGFNVKDGDEGIIFVGRENSMTQSEVFDSGAFNNPNILINTWFTPYPQTNPKETTLFKIRSKNSAISLFDTLHIKISQTLTEALLSIDFYAGGSFTHYSSPTNLSLNGLNNVQLLSLPTGMVAKINGENYFVNTNPISLNHNSSNLFQVQIGSNFYGEINYITLHASTDVNVNETLMQTQYELGYPLPRKKELVDLSDEFEVRGKNLFVEGHNISKAIETLKGELYIKSNTINLRS